jgi:hypothetical protein
MAQDTFGNWGGGEEIASGREGCSREPDQREQTLESFAKKLIVIDNCDQSVGICLFRCSHAGKLSSERRPIPASGSKTSYTLVLPAFDQYSPARRGTHSGMRFVRLIEITPSFESLAAAKPHFL